MPTSADVVNQALEYIAAQTRITSLTDGTPAAVAANTVYTPVVELLLRELDPDFARFDKTLDLSAGTPPIPIWAYEYLYPSDCLRFRQMRPALASNADINDPQPIRFSVGIDFISSVATKVIFSNQVSAHGIYTTSRVTEDQWDSVFTDAVARRLANPLAMALSGRPDFAREILDEAARVAATADAVDESAVRR